MSFYEQNLHQFTVPTITQTMEVAAPQSQVPSFTTTHMVYSTGTTSIVDGSSSSAAVHGVSVNPDQENPSFSYERVQSNYAFNGLPPGIRFQPTDYELIFYYLMPKIMKQVIPSAPIRDVNLYERSPDEIAEIYEELKEGEGFFFTPRDRKYPNGERPNRGTGGGYWKATGSDKAITKPESSTTIGLKKTLVYYEGQPKDQKGVKTSWIMHEYCLKHEKGVKRSEINTRLDDFILCRIYKKGKKLFQGRQPVEVQGHGRQPAEVQGLSSEVGHPFVSTGTPCDEYLQGQQPAEVQGPYYGNGMFQNQENMGYYGNFHHSSGFVDEYLNNFRDSQLEPCNVKGEVALAGFDYFLTDYNHDPSPMVNVGNPGAAGFLI